LYLTAKFDRPKFSRSEVIVRTNKQTDAAENIHLALLRYCRNGPVTCRPTYSHVDFLLEINK